MASREPRWELQPTILWQLTSCMTLNSSLNFSEVQFVASVLMVVRILSFKRLSRKRYIKALNTVLVREGVQNALVIFPIFFQK